MCVTPSRYMKIGENLLNEVLNEEKSILVDFDQIITLVNKWKAKWFMKDIHGSKKKKTHQNDRSVGITPPSDLLFLLRTIARIHERPFNEGFN